MKNIIAMKNIAPLAVFVLGLLLGTMLVALTLWLLGSGDFLSGRRLVGWPTYQVRFLPLPIPLPVRDPW
jgi:hypothetical protein